MRNSDNKKGWIKRVFRPQVVALALALIMVFGNAFDLAAQPAPPAASEPAAIPTYGLGPDPVEGENLSCRHRMGRFIVVEQERYFEWMEQHFRNKSSSSSLLDLAFARYEEYATLLRSELLKAQGVQVPEGVLQITEGVEYGDCESDVENALSTARELLAKRARSTSSTKKTTALLDKYKEINGQMRDLDSTFLSIKAYLTTFADKLPCYIQDMCNKG